MAAKKAQVKKVGLDTGNGLLKMQVDGNPQGMLIPTVVMEVLAKQTDAAVFNENVESVINYEKLEQNLDFTFVSSKALKENGKRYYIGEIIDNNRLNKQADEMSVKSQKWTEEIPVITALAALAVDAMRSNPGSGKSITATYDLSLALPMVDTDKDKFEKHSSRFIGVHELEFHIPDSNDKIKITINIEFATCTPEGAIGSYAVIYDLEGMPIEYEIKVRNNAITRTFEEISMILFDIGAGTVENVVSEGIKLVKNKDISGGDHNGVKVVINKVIEAWNSDNTPDPIANVAEFTKIYLDKNHFLNNELIVYAEEYLRNHAQKYANAIKNKFQLIGGKSETRIIIYGGGAQLLEKYLRESLVNAGLSHNVHFIPEPIFVNAKGLLIFAKTAAFEARKQRALAEV